jgi:hypothetical protein
LCSIRLRNISPLVGRSLCSLSAPNVHCHSLSRICFLIECNHIIERKNVLWFLLKVDELNQFWLVHDERVANIVMNTFNLCIHVSFCNYTAVEHIDIAKWMPQPHGWCANLTQTNQLRMLISLYKSTVFFARGIDWPAYERENPEMWVSSWKKIVFASIAITCTFFMKEKFIW